MLENFSCFELWKFGAQIVGCFLFGKKWRSEVSRGFRLKWTKGRWHFELETKLWKWSATWELYSPNFHLLLLAVSYHHVGFAAVLVCCLFLKIFLFLSENLRCFFFFFVVVIFCFTHRAKLFRLVCVSLTITVLSQSPFVNYIWVLQPCHVFLDIGNYPISCHLLNFIYPAS